MITGEFACVLRRKSVVVDAMGEPVYGPWEPEIDPVEVLVVPGTSTELDETRPDGVRVAYTLHFPKSYRASLRGCMVRIRGFDYRVVGDPQPYTDANVPGHWNRPVEAEAVDG